MGIGWERGSRGRNSPLCHLSVQFRDYPQDVRNGQGQEEL